MGMDVGGCCLPLCDTDAIAAERLLACLKKYGLVEIGSKAGSATARRPPESLLWRVNH